MAALAFRQFQFSCKVFKHIPACITQQNYLSTSYVLSAKVKAAAKAKMMAQMAERKRMTVETDPEKLVNYVCGANVMANGEDPKIKPDSEYPDWLWTLHTERGATPLEELDEDSSQYWRIVKRRERARRAKLSGTKHKYSIYGRPIIK